MIAAALAAAALALAPAPPPVDRAAAARAAAWIAAQPATTAGGVEADAVLALVAAGRRRGAHLVRLRALAPRYAVTPGAAAKTALAAVAAGSSARCFAGVDLVRRMRAGYFDGVFGASIWDQSLSIMALAGAHEPIPPAALRTLRRLRGEGGWGFAISGAGADDADSTALAVMALRAAGRGRSDADVRAGVRWLLAHRLPGAGWAGAAGSATVANSTGLALRALAAAGSGPPAGATAALRALQSADGSFAATAAAGGSRQLATNEAVPALLRRPLPLARRRHADRPCAQAGAGSGSTSTSAWANGERASPQNATSTAGPIPNAKITVPRPSTPPRA